MSTRKAMAEAAWLECTEATAMLKHLQQHCRITKAPGGRRRLRLFACACCRRIAPYLDATGCRMVELSELEADGLANRQQLAEARQWAAKVGAARWQPGIQPRLDSASEATAAVAHTAGPRFGSGAAEMVALSAHLAAACAATGTRPSDQTDRQRWHDAVREENRVHCDFIRDIFGNPFRSKPSFQGRGKGSALEAIARGIYSDGASDRLPILADALEEAGCTDEAILAHCRGPGEHVRGCWVVDLLVGKE